MKTEKGRPCSHMDAYLSSHSRNCAEIEGDRLKEINAELLAALKVVLRDGCAGWDEMVRAVIAKAEGK